MQEIKIKISHLIAVVMHINQLKRNTTFNVRFIKPYEEKSKPLGVVKTVILGTFDDKLKDCFKR